jgi:hypothetical protein
LDAVAYKGLTLSLLAVHLSSVDEIRDSTQNAPKRRTEGAYLRKRLITTATGRLTPHALTIEPTSDTMKEGNAVRRRLLAVVASLVILLLAAIVINHYRYAGEMATALFTPQDQEIVKTTTRMAELRNENQFDDAIQLGLRSIKGHPETTTSSM